MQRVRTLIIIGLLGALLAACGGNQPTPAPANSNTSDPTATTAADAPTTASATAVPATAAPTTDLAGLLNGGGEKITLTLTGGAHAGTHEVTTDEGACSYGLAGEGAGWGNQYSIDTTDPNAFSSLQLIAQNVKIGETSTNQFMTTISFGELFSASETTYEIMNLDGSGANGNGTVTIDDKGETATISIKGETADGVGIDATIECLSVIRLGGGESDGPIMPANGLELEISGGDLAGSYSLTLPSEVSACGAGENNSSVLIESLEDGQRAASLTFDYYDENETLGQLQLLVADASAGKTSQFYLSINDQTFYAENLSGADDSVGTVEVDDQGDSATITIDAKAADGTTVKGTLVCNSIER